MSEKAKPEIGAFIKVEADPGEDAWFGSMWGTVTALLDDYFRMDAGADVGEIDISYTNTWETAE